jgi:hypothetical protein
LIITGILSLITFIFFNDFVYAQKLAPNGIFDYILNKIQNIRITESHEKFESPKNIKGIYITADTMSTVRQKELIDSLVANGGNAVVIDIQHGGGLLAFNPKTEFLKQVNPGRKTLNNMPEIINELHKKGIYVIARQVVFNDPYVSQLKPEWRIKNKWGGLFDYRWLDPSKAGVQIYNIYLMQEVAAMGFDEIQFDYIRFPATNHNSLDYYYDEEKFTRADVINDFLKKARRIADYYNIKLGVDVFGAIIWGDVDWKIVGQNASEMAKHVDVIYPMTYPSHVSPGYYGFTNPWGDPYSFVKGSIEKFVKAVNGEAEIRTWIQGFNLKSPNFGTWYMEAQVKASFDAGADGFTIWSPGNHYTYSWPVLSLNPEVKTESTAQ